MTEANTSETTPQAHFKAMEAIDKHAAKCGLTTYKLVLAANMDPSCLSRWRRGGLPNGRSLERLFAVPVPEKQG